MRGGIWVLNIFGAIWGAAAVIVGHQLLWLALVPPAISATILLWARRQPMPNRTAVDSAHVGRLVGIWSAVEGVAMFVTANILINMHFPTALMPAFAIIVGLHFIPLARGIPVRAYYGTAAALIAVGVVALLLPPADQALVTGSAAALIMWASVVALMQRGRA